MSTPTSQDDDIEPLSGKPFAHVMMLKSHVKSPYTLQVPMKLARMLPSKTTSVIVFRGSRTWDMSFLGTHPTHKRLDPRWKAFVLDNKLKIGDICVFELIESDEALIKLKVQVLRGDFPSVLLDRQDGSQNKPVVIDDD